MMHKEFSVSKNQYFAALKSLQQLRRYVGAHAGFWQLYVKTAAEITGASMALAVTRLNKPGSSWQTLAFFPDKEPTRDIQPTILELLPPLEEKVMQSSPAVSSQDHFSLGAATLKTGSQAHLAMLVIYIPNAAAEYVNKQTALLSLLTDIPQSYLSQKALERNKLQQNHFAEILDLSAQLDNSQTFGSTAITLCNELAARYHCERVSLGWIQRGYVRMQAVSNSDEFDKKMDAVVDLEMAMEECVDQNAEIILPAGQSTNVIYREHEVYGKGHDVKIMASFPLRNQEEVLGVLTLERNQGEFNATELQILRLAADQNTQRLARLKESDRWLGAITASRFRKHLGKIIGYEHTWVKLTVALIVLIFGFICFVPVKYRFEAPVILRTHEISYLTAPYDGHIETVQVRVGDEVSRNQGLLELERDDLLQEEARLMAEKKLHQRESEKARAAAELVDMRISEARLEQSSAELAIVQSHLKKSRIQSPFQGVIVEGDQMERIGSPVAKGDVLFKVAGTQKMFAELEVSENDIHLVRSPGAGQIALASRPQDPVAISVVRVEPAAVSKSAGNVFMVHAEFTREIPNWWRPGMTGIGKLNAEKKTLLWIFTHRTVEFLRLKLWW